MHNRPWSNQEKIFFLILIVITIAVSTYLLLCGKIFFSQAVGMLLLIVFLGIVFGSTVFTRMPSPQRDYKLKLFWSWREVYYGDVEMLKKNLLNMVLLLPAGILLPVIFKHRISWRFCLIVGGVISAGIEISQLLLCRGLFEWDDIIHNAFGCMIGGIISSWCIKK